MSGVSAGCGEEPGAHPTFCTFHPGKTAASALLAPRTARLGLAPPALGLMGVVPTYGCTERTEALNPGKRSPPQPTHGKPCVQHSWLVPGGPALGMRGPEGPPGTGRKGLRGPKPGLGNRAISSLT